MASQRLRIGMELDLGEETEYCPCWRQTSKEEGQFDHHQDQHQHHQDQHQHHQCLSLYLMERMHSEKLFGCLFCRSYGRISEAACPQEELAASKLCDPCTSPIGCSHWSSPHPTLVMDKGGI